MLVENIEAGPLAVTFRRATRPISSRPRDGGTCRQTVSRPMSGPGRRFLAWAAAASFDPRSLPFPAALEAYRFLGEGKNAASLKQIRAALSFAYKHWDLKNPFAKIEPPLHKEPQIRYLLLSDIRRLLDYLKASSRATAPPSRST